MVDGFTDFTRPQHEILETIAGRSTHYRFPCRAVKRAGTVRVVRQAQRHPPGTRATIAEPSGPVARPPRASGLASPGACRRRAVQKPTPGPPRRRGNGHRSQRGGARNRRDLSRRAADQAIARRRRWPRPRLAPARDLAMRSPSGLVPLLREAFDEIGIPTRSKMATPWPSAPSRRLVAVVRLHVEDWPFRGLLHVLGNNYFRPKWDRWCDSANIEGADRTIPAGCRFRGPRGPVDGDLRGRRSAARARGCRAIEASPTSPPDARNSERLAAAYDRLPRRAMPVAGSVCGPPWPTNWGSRAM